MSAGQGAPISVAWAGMMPRNRAVDALVFLQNAGPVEIGLRGLEQTLLVVDVCRPLIAVLL